MSTNSPSPDEILSEIDKGDDVQKRYRYQAAYAAITSLDLFDENSEFEEVFCEHHEDILVKRKNQKFIGIQVKTRRLSRGPFTFNDLEIIKSLIRFVTIEKEFPNHFDRYVIAANCGFWQKKRSSRNLVYCLKSLREDEPTILSDVAFQKNLKRIGKATGYDQDFVIKVLRKVRTQQSPSLESYLLQIVRSMVDLKILHSERVDLVFETANSLIDDMFKAASLSHSSPKSAYFAFLEDPETEQKNDIIDGKRITKSRIEQVIKEKRKSFLTFQSSKTVSLSNLPRGMRKMEIKMAKGGLSFQNIDLAKDLKSSAEALLVGWIYQYNLTEAEKRHQHLRVVVRSICQEAYDLTKTNGELFGENMLEEVRNRLRDRFDNDIVNKYGEIDYEHLLGIAAILTEECKIWWSEIFDLPKEVVV